MAVTVTADFGDAAPVWTCECGVRCFGDAVVDAFRNWWKHVAEAHPMAFG
jgi:hypothetical protein